MPAFPWRRLRSSSVSRSIGSGRDEGTSAESQGVHLSSRSQTEAEDIRLRDRGARPPPRRSDRGRAVAAPRRLPDYAVAGPGGRGSAASRSEEHTSELQSLTNLVCRLLLEK